MVDAQPGRRLQMSLTIHGIQTEDRLDVVATEPLLPAFGRFPRKRTKTRPWASRISRSETGRVSVHGWLLKCCGWVNDTSKCKARASDEEPPD